MAAPMGHDRTRKEKQEDEEEDPVETMLKKTGCIEKHYAVQVGNGICSINEGNMGKHACRDI